MAIKLYRYHFKDTDKIITIEANDREEARSFLQTVLAHMPEMKDHPLINEKIESPISGVTEKKHNGQDYVWFSNGRNEGWMLKTDYDKIILKK